MMAEGPLDISEIVKYFNLNNANVHPALLHLCTLHVFSKRFKNSFYLQHYWVLAVPKTNWKI